MDFNKIFHKVPVQVQNRSAFNCGHKNLFTASVGTLVPCLVDPLIPNTTINLGLACQVQLPPLATDFYGSIRAKMEAFFVPYRIIWNGWRDFITLPASGRTDEQLLVNPSSPTSLPAIELNFSDDSVQMDLFSTPGGLADMLGFKSKPELTDDNPTGLFTLNNILPFLAYHKIYDDWYRDSRIQRPIFYNSIGALSTNSWTTAPYFNGVMGGEAGPSFYSAESHEGFSIFQLHQRNWQRDYFTNATPLPQSGTPASVQFQVQNGTGELTIAALRAANSLQQWYERNNIAGERYSDQIKARFGVYPSDSITDRAIYLGQKTFDIYTRSVYETISMPGVSDTTVNPFNGNMAAKSSSVQGFGEDTLVPTFTATEHGFIMVIFSLVPEPLYSSGTRRYLGYRDVVDFPDPLLQGVGDQPIYSWEVDNSQGPHYNDWYDPTIFGYTQRYSEAKYMNDEVHGLLRDGESLQGFALQRFIDGSENAAEISTEFITIPPDYLDQVSNVNAQVSNYGCWAECYFRYNKIQPLAAYSIPTLGDPRDTHTEIIDNGGKRL